LRACNVWNPERAVSISEHFEAERWQQLFLDAQVSKVGQVRPYGLKPAMMFQNRADDRVIVFFDIEGEHRKML
jgi:hypothetical protein